MSLVFLSSHAVPPVAASRARLVGLLCGVLALGVYCGGANAADAVATASAVSNVRILPSYHLAPVLPGEPSAVDRDGSSTSAHLAPRSVAIPAALNTLATKALTYQEVANGSLRAQSLTAGSAFTPMAATPRVTYSPAQIRAAYGLPPVPSNLSNLTPLQAAQLGAGQTIYVIDAFHDPFAYGELLSFSSLFGLPGCDQKTLAPSASLPLPAASKTACEFYQVPSSDAGAIGSTAPRYDAQWAIEIAIDIQWAHAIAPLARIVLIEAAVDSMAGITNAIQLANRMGAGVVSMSFVAPEGSYVTTNDALFQTRGMSYFAATGDNATAVNWPAVSPSVVAVGGTTLTYSGSGARTEKAWSLAGGGISGFVATPTYQSANSLRSTTVSHRSVADVAMNADPTTGQFIAVVPNPLTCTFCQISWLTAGGTSLATPQWAGLAAVANAMRLQMGKDLLGAPHTLLYQALSNTTTYATAFLDVTQGANGTCTTCTAKTGYDGPTGLGTPNGTGLLTLLVGSAIPPTPPTVVASTVNGKYGEPISFTPSVSSPNAYSLSITSAPAGVALSGSVINWPNPTTGTFSIKLTAKDQKTGLTGQGTYTVVVAPPPAPIVSSASLAATVGKALSFPVGVGDRYPCRLSLVGAPAGMTLSSTGMNSGTVNWPNPVAGTYRFAVKADDSQTAMSAQGSYSVTVNPASAPTVAGGNVAGRVGTALDIDLGMANPSAYAFNLVGAPSGMAVSAAGHLSWPAPVAGNYSVTVQAKDSKTGLVGAGVVNISIGSAAGPAFFNTPMVGVAGKPFTGTILITDSGANLIGGGFGASNGGIRCDIQLGNGKIVVTWAAPVAGTYTLQASITDSAGKSAIALIPLVITAK